MIDVGAQQLFACDECPIISQLDYRLSIATVGHPVYRELRVKYAKIQHKQNTLCRSKVYRG